MTRTPTASLVAGLSLALVTHLAAGAAEKPQRVELATADGVELVARYSPGPQGTKSPTVIVLDGVGENRRPKACDAIAAELHKLGCATLCFDFRGHGGSTIVTPAFWDDPTNRKLVRGYKAKGSPEQITFGDFKPGYFRTLVNDIATARAFLDRRNDAGECNSGHLMVVGLREGASIGAMWVATEWSRYRVTGGFNTRLAASPEGRDILACVWVEPETEYDRQRVPLLDCVKRAAGKRTTHVELIHAKADEALAKLADQCANALNAKKSAPFHATVVDVGWNGNVTDQDYLATGVAGVMKPVIEAQEPPPWDDRDFAEKRYAWSLPNGGVVLAKEEDERTLRPVPIDRLIAR